MFNRLEEKIMLFPLLILAFFLFASLFGFYTAIRPVKFVSKITPHDIGLEFEEVFFVTKDNIKLQGWFIPRQPSVENSQPAKTIILLHGYPADKGNILPSFAFLNENFDLFLFDFRYFGKSDGKYTTAGIKELGDLEAAIRYLGSRGIHEVGVYGFSMGGAVALMAAPYTSEIKAVISEASYSRLDKIAPQLYIIPALKHPLGWLTGFWAKLFLGIDMRSMSPANKIQPLTTPVLIIHSPLDTVIPFSHALELKEALKNNPQGEFWFPDNLVHGEHNYEFRQALEDFFLAHL